MSYEILQRASRRILVAWVLVALASGSAFALVVPALPAETEVDAKDQRRAEVAYGKAYEAYGNGDTAGALKQANRAFKALPNASTALIRATILSAMNRTQKAFEAYLVAADLNPVPDELQLIDAGLAQTGTALSPPMGWTSFKTTPTGAKVGLGEGSFKAPRTVGLPAGQHYFNISAAGHVGTSGTVTVSAGRGSNLSFALAAAQRQEAVIRTSPTPAAAAPAAASPIQPVRVATAQGLPEKSQALAYSMMSLGGAALLGGGVVLSGVQSKVDEAQAPGNNEAQYNDLLAEAQSSQMMAFVLMGVGVGALGYGIYDMMSSPEGEATAQWKATAVPTYGGGALVLSGSF
jgi:tetratricopeptide (TPR) repeat protein